MALLRSSRPDGAASVRPAARRSRRALRVGVATLAVTLAGGIGIVVPGFEQAATATDTVQAAADAPTGPGSVATFDRTAATSRQGSSRVTTGELNAAVDARHDQLGVVTDELTATQVEAGLAARAAALSRANAQIKAEADRLAQEGTFFRPTTGEIGSKFGPRRHPILGYVRVHAGWDIGGSCGQPIWAALPGTVVEAAAAGQSGNFVRVDHGTVKGVKLQTTYMHMQSFGVKAGDKVTRGQRLGAVGNTGLSTACHLHFGVIENGSNGDPAKYVKG